MAAGDVTVSFPKVYRPTPNDGTPSGGVTISDGAMVFDGVDGAVATTITSNTLFNSGFSVSAWIYPLSIGETAGMIISKADGATAQNGVHIALSSVNRITIRINSSSGMLSANNAVPYNQWTHVIFTIDENNLSSCFINGEPNGVPNSLNLLSAITTAQPLTIGNRAGATDRTFNGSIDDVQIYNRALSPKEITAQYNLGRGKYAINTNGLVAQYSGRDFAGTALLPTKIYDTKNVNPRSEDTSFIDTAISEARVNANSKFLMVPGNKGQVYVTHIEEAA